VKNKPAEIEPWAKFLDPNRDKVSFNELDGIEHFGKQNGTVRIELDLSYK